MRQEHGTKRYSDLFHLEKTADVFDCHINYCENSEKNRFHHFDKSLGAYIKANCLVDFADS